ncbi:MAG: DUF4266 domain-containing protein [Leptothrix sp. (in: b-proteobacteria)]
MTRPSAPIRRPLWRPLVLLAGLAALTPLMGGCAQIANLGVQPWERDLMAKPSMQLITSPLDAAADDHTYFSKEAATGGRGFGGGGCGCN